MREVWNFAKATRRKTQVSCHSFLISLPQVNKYHFTWTRHMAKQTTALRKPETNLFNWKSLMGDLIIKQERKSVTDTPRPYGLGWWAQAICFPGLSVWGGRGSLPGSLLDPQPWRSIRELALQDPHPMWDASGWANIPASCGVSSRVPSGN